MKRVVGLALCGAMLGGCTLLGIKSDVQVTAEQCAREVDKASAEAASTIPDCKKLNYKDSAQMLLCGAELYATSQKVRDAVPACKDLIQVAKTVVK